MRSGLFFGQIQASFAAGFRQLGTAAADQRQNQGSFPALIQHKFCNQK
jgi:hypothetical protein